MWNSEYKRLELPSPITDDDMADTTTHIPKSGRWSERFHRFAPSPVNLYIAVLVTAMAVVQFTRPSSVAEPALPQPRDFSSDWLEKQYIGDIRYMTLDHHYDHLWTFSGNATVKVPDPTFGEEVESILSMMHQLHCLSSFRTALQKAYFKEPVAFDYHGDMHWPHCLDYLRQTFLCYADSTPELPIIKDGKRTQFIDGQQDIRRCRAPDSLLRLHTLPAGSNI